MTTELLTDLTIFALAVLVGFEVISKVPATLHTPLMSGANSIHGVVLIGAMVITASVSSTYALALGAVAMAFAAMNVVGANDVTNPAARRAGNPISGMPILDVDHAKSIIAIKRSLGHGYAGLDNELYADPKTEMFFSAAKKGLAALLAAMKTLVALCLLVCTASDRGAG